MKPAQNWPTPASDSFSCLHQTCTNLTHSCLWILLNKASNLRKPHPLLCLTLLIQASNLHKPLPLCVWILLMLAWNLRKPHQLPRLNLSHVCIKPAQTSPTPASESFSYTHQPAQTSPTPASEFFSYKHQTCTNLTHSCFWILLKQASNLHKPHPIVRLNPSHTSIKTEQTSTTLASESFSCVHQICKNLIHSCVRILLIQASNLHKPHPLLRLNPSHRRIKPAQTSPTLRLNPPHTSIRPAQTSPTPAPESFSYKHQACTNLTHSCVWILLMRAPNLHTPRSLLRLNPSHTSIKPAQISPSLASESFSCLHQTCANLTDSCVWILLILHQTCTNLTHSCFWILLIQASNLHKPHPLLRLNPSQTSIKPAQTSTNRASASFSYKHQYCTNLNHSCVWILLFQASKLHKTHPLLRLNPYHACIKPAHTSLTPASKSFSYEHQTCTNLTHSCIWILLKLASNLHKPRPLLPLNPSHTRIKPAQTSPTPASEFFSYKHQTCTKLPHSCVWIFFMHASNLHKPHPPASEFFSMLASNLHQPHPLLRLNPSHTSIKPAQTSPTLASESFSCVHQTCTHLAHSCV